MSNLKYREGMTFAQFMYANYGFNYTREQADKANVYYLRLFLKTKATT